MRNWPRRAAKPKPNAAATSPYRPPEGETTRLNRDMAAERARIAATLLAEREAMTAEFEENRLQVATEAFRTGVQMETAGMLKPDVSAPPANLIEFPGREGHVPGRARSREHGFVGP
ncbi:hypothetical protein ACH40E_26380 [Streptomyces acidicola]|uniref:hypothetical protein n=1 Tax=Streptomyces acidicola TaxID=2596892 RepID=UPI00378A5F29